MNFKGSRLKFQQTKCRLPVASCYNDDFDVENDNDKDNIVDNNNRNN